MKTWKKKKWWSNDSKEKGDLQEEERLFQLHGGEQRNLHVCSYHLQSKFYRNSWLAVCWEYPTLQALGTHPFALATKQFMSRPDKSDWKSKLRSWNELSTIPDLMVVGSFEHILHLSLHLPVPYKIKHLRNIPWNWFRLDTNRLTLTCIVTLWSWQISCGGKLG